MSTKNAGLAKKMGYKNVQVMLKGVPGWKKNRGYVVASDEFVHSGNVVLLDVRSQNEYEQGHIKGAYNIPLMQLTYDFNSELPRSMTAPIVVYGNKDDGRRAYNVIKKMQRKTGAVMTSSLEEWIANGNKLIKGPSPEEIVWTRKLGKGEISLTEFNSIWKNQSQDHVILDVRTNEEIKTGMFKGAKSIPLDKLSARYNELPKDKVLITHCATGARAEMAYQELLNKGFQSRYLVANVECDEDGCEAE